MKTPNIHTYFLLLITLLLAACTQLIPTAPQSPATGDIPIEQAIQSVLDLEAQAREAKDQAALQQLLDPDADLAWTKRFQSVSDDLIAIELKRIMVTNQWVLAAVITTEQFPGQDDLHQAYTYRTLHNRGAEGWKLTSPIAETWGQPLKYTMNCPKFTYYTFDVPYVLLVAQKIEDAYRQMGADFALPVCQEGKSLTLHVVPADKTLPFWEETTGYKINSPLTVGFPLDLSETPEEFLLGFTVDYLGHILFEKHYDEYDDEMSRRQLAHLAIQWEVEDATGRSHRQHMLTRFDKIEEPMPLLRLLDPTEEITRDSGPLQRELLSYFIAETYGRSAWGPFVQAVFKTDSAYALAEAAFGLTLEDVERQWQAWLAASREEGQDDSSNWQTYREADDLFIVEHPPGWRVHEAGSAQSDRIWEFTHPESQQSVITVVKYLTKIPADMPLEAWIEQTKNYEFNFERIHEEAITLEDADAYLIHDRLVGGERDAYITYLRCMGTVWSLHLIGSIESSEELETLYQEVLTTFRPACPF